MAVENRPMSRQPLWRLWLSLLAHVWATVVVVGFACMLWILRAGSPEVRLAYHVFYLLLYSALVAVPLAVQTLAAAVVIWAAGIGNLWVRALVGAVTAGLGALLYASPGDGTPQFVIITVGSAIGAGLQSIRSVKPANPTAV